MTKTTREIEKSKNNNVAVFCISFSIFFFFLSIFATYLMTHPIQSETPTQTIPPLEKILRGEMVNIANWTCYEYADYYNQILSCKHPELDIRWIRQFDVCNNQTLCEDTHTFLIIGGYGQECLLDQKTLLCVTLDI